MNSVIKILTSILGIMAVAACLATIGIIGYSLLGGETDNAEAPIIVQVQPTEVPVLSETPQPEESVIKEPVLEDLSEHIHDYEVEVEVSATCYRAGRLKYVCTCGDTYYVDVLSTGHVADEWVITQIPTKDAEGRKVQKCIYCDEIISQEILPRIEDKEKTEIKEETPHIHQYVASVEREAGCVLAGLRKYTCSCGSFYTEKIPAPGHVASDWTLAAGATSSYMGTEQRICNVCGTVLDSRPTTKTDNNTASAAASASPASGNTPTATPAATASANPSSSASPAASAVPSATPHVHSYRSYVLKEANCTEKGIRSFVCGCGSEYAESIELDMNHHTYKGVVIPATETTQGYTVFTCIRCNYSYFDNYTPALGQNNNN